MIMLPNISKELTYTVYVITGVLRVGVFMVNAKFLSRHHFKEIMTEIDLLLLVAMGSCVSYGAFTMSFNSVSGNNGSVLLRSAAVAVYVLLTIGMVYQIRAMLKFFPWTTTTIWIYRFVRVYAAVFYIITEVAIEERETDRSESFIKSEQLVSNTRVLFVASTLHYLYDAFEKVNHRYHKFHKEQEGHHKYVRLNVEPHH
jgi:uncharacterized membrane protein